MLFIGVLDNQRYFIKILDGEMRVINGAMTVMKGSLQNGFYNLYESTILNTEAVATDQDQKGAWLWHMRLADISEKGLLELCKQGLLSEDNISRLDFHETCTLGKSSRVKFAPSAYKSKGILDYIHSDLWGLERVASKGGSRYFMTLIDGYSRRAWIYL